jgi:hypothetical protein
MRENAFKSMEYADVDAVVEAGWRPYSDEELDIPLDAEDTDGTEDTDSSS